MLLLHEWFIWGLGCGWLEYNNQFFSTMDTFGHLPLHYLSSTNSLAFHNLTEIQHSKEVQEQHVKRAAKIYYVRISTLYFYVKLQEASDRVSLPKQKTLVLIILTSGKETSRKNKCSAQCPDLNHLPSSLHAPLDDSTEKIPALAAGHFILKTPTTPLQHEDIHQKESYFRTDRQSGAEEDCYIKHQWV